MALVSGTRLGVYEILSPLGAGGMGEVYRARDTKLNRDVALKVLPTRSRSMPIASRASSARRRCWPRSTIRNIAAIYGLEDIDGTHALVMELVEGPTLADRIAQRPVPLDEALADRADRSPTRSKRRTSRGSSIAI